MQFRIPRINEINCEIKDYEYYFENPFNEKELGVSYHVRTSFHDPDILLFFIHFRYSYGEQARSLYHCDYLSQFQLDQEFKEEKEMVSVEKEYLSHLLGTSILMIRGAMNERLRGHILREYPFPIINPMELLEKDLTSSENKFLIVPN